MLAMLGSALISIKAMEICFGKRRHATLPDKIAIASMQIYVSKIMQLMAKTCNPGDKR
jgi:hypothetical protein